MHHSIRSGDTQATGKWCLRADALLYTLGEPNGQTFKRESIRVNQARYSRFCGCNRGVQVRPMVSCSGLTIHRVSLSPTCDMVGVRLNQHAPYAVFPMLIRPSIHTPSHEQPHALANMLRRPNFFAPLRKNLRRCKAPPKNNH
jgi:hypothetical protein